MCKINQFIKQLIIILPDNIPTGERKEIFYKIKKDLVKMFDFDANPDPDPNSRVEYFYTTILPSNIIISGKHAVAKIEGYYSSEDTGNFSPSAKSKELLDKYTLVLNSYLEKWPYK